MRLSVTDQRGTIQRATGLGIMQIHLGLTKLDFDVGCESFVFASRCDELVCASALNYSSAMFFTGCYGFPEFAL